MFLWLLDIHIEEFGVGGLKEQDWTGKVDFVWTFRQGWATRFLTLGLIQFLTTSVGPDGEFSMAVKQIVHRFGAERLCRNAFFTIPSL